MAYYKDFNLNFETKNDGDIKAEENEEAVKNAIENILSTLQGERRMLPEFAENLYNILFDPIDEDTAGYIEDIILAAIERWDDRVSIKSVVADPYPDWNKYVATLLIEVSNIGEIKIVKDILK